MEKSIKGTKTEKNLLKAFAGESQAKNRYEFAAKVAKEEGYEQIAGIFLERYGVIPEVGQEIYHHHITLRVDATSKKRIEKVSVLIDDINA